MKNLYLKSQILNYIGNIVTNWTLNCKREKMYKWEFYVSICVHVKTEERTLESPAVAAFFAFLRRDFRCLVTAVWPASLAWSTVNVILDSSKTTVTLRSRRGYLLAWASLLSEISHDRLTLTSECLWSSWWFVERQLMICCRCGLLLTLVASHSQHGLPLATYQESRNNFNNQISRKCSKFNLPNFAANGLNFWNYVV